MKPSLLSHPVFRTCTSRAGFTLTELLVVIAIVGILAAIIIPVTVKLRDSAKAVESLSNVKSIAQSALLFSNDNRRMLPTLGTGAGFSAPRWPQQMEVFLPAPYLQPELNVNGLHSIMSPILVDPLVPDGKHGTQADYGANKLIFIPGDVGTGLRLSEVPNPSRTIMLVTAWGSSSQGASWYIEADAYIANVNTNIRPDDRGRGNMLAVFVDGHAAAIPKAEFETRRAELLRPTQ